MQKGQFKGACSCLIGLKILCVSLLLRLSVYHHRHGDIFADITATKQWGEWMNIMLVRSGTMFFKHVHYGDLSSLTYIWHSCPLKMNYTLYISCSVDYKKRRIMWTFFVLNLNCSSQTLLNLERNVYCSVLYQYILRFFHIIREYKRLYNAKFTITFVKYCSLKSEI